MTKKYATANPSIGNNEDLRAPLLGNGPIADGVCGFRPITARQLSQVRCQHLTVATSHHASANIGRGIDLHTVDPHMSLKIPCDYAAIAFHTFFFLFGQIY